ncbi:MAG: hypothetical protein WAX89_03500 [Alphaproteobacteria bacterium]
MESFIDSLDRYPFGPSDVVAKTETLIFVRMHLPNVRAVRGSVLGALLNPAAAERWARRIFRATHADLFGLRYVVYVAKNGGCVYGTAEKLHPGHPHQAKALLGLTSGLPARYAVMVPSKPLEVFLSEEATHPMDRSDYAVGEEVVIFPAASSPGTNMHACAFDGEDRRRNKTL